LLFLTQLLLSKDDKQKAQLQSVFREAQLDHDELSLYAGSGLAS